MWDVFSSDLFFTEDPQPIPSLPLTVICVAGTQFPGGSREPHPPLPSKMLCVRLIRMAWGTRFHLRRLFVEEGQLAPGL